MTNRGSFVSGVLTKQPHCDTLCFGVFRFFGQLAHALDGDDDAKDQEQDSED